MRVMITGGGTGGHTSPAVAVLEELRRRDPQLVVQWVGRRGGMEEQVSQMYGVPFRALPVEGWPRTAKWRRPWVAMKLAWSIFRASVGLYRFRPQVVLGVGGYVSLPLAWVAQRMGVHTVLHEQNKRLGMANRILAPRASRLYLSYEDTLGAYPRDKAIVVGNPVRTGFAAPPEKRVAREALGLEPDIPVVLICGGSQGARSINEAIAGALPGFATEEAQFIWMTGKSSADAARQVASSATAKVKVFPYIEDMVTACAAADLMVSRSGASTTAELAVLGKPSLLVPYPYATDNHQEQNARAFEQVGAAEVLLDGECTPETLGGRIRALLSEPGRLEEMGAAALSLAKPQAADTIVEGIMTLVFGEANSQ